MRQLFLEKGIAKVIQVAQPVLDAHLVMVAVHYSFIYKEEQVAVASQAASSVFSHISLKLKTVLELLASRKNAIPPEIRSLGYSVSGRVLAVGSAVKGVRPGDFVACAGIAYAYHADIVCVPHYLVVRIPNEQLVKTASIIAMGAEALHAIRRAQLQLGEYVCVIGLNLLGNLIAQLAQLAGCKVIAIDNDKDRIALAQEMGIYRGYDSTDAATAKEIAFVTQHQGVDCTFVAQNGIIPNAQYILHITRAQGKAVIVPEVDIHLLPTVLYQKEIALLITSIYKEYQQTVNKSERWNEQRNMREFVELLEHKKISVDKLLPEEIGIQQVPALYDQIKSPTSKGLLVRYIPEIDRPIEYHSRHAAAITFMPSSRKHLRVGLIGAGTFAKVKLLPALSRIQTARLTAVVDSDIANATNIARLYDAPHAFSSDRQMLYEDVVDVVIIDSAHHAHADQTLAALRHGKAVFVERPLATTHEQLAMLELFLKEHKTIPLCVDYNRSFAPFTQKIKKIVAKRSSPLMLYYRMNVGILPKEEWLKTPADAGRIIGEAVHVIDLFYELIGTNPVAVSVDACVSNREDVFPTDNFCATITFSDGSVASLLYTALGNRELGKERMELFFDGKSIVVDNYVRLIGFGTPRSFNQSLVVPDKGHEHLMRLFFEGLKHPQVTVPIPIQRLISVTRLTLIIDELACTGGGYKEIATHV